MLKRTFPMHRKCNSKSSFISLFILSSVIFSFDSFTIKNAGDCEITYLQHFSASFNVKFERCFELSISVFSGDFYTKAIRLAKNTPELP